MKARSIFSLAILAISATSVFSVSRSQVTQPPVIKVIVDGEQVQFGEISPRSIGGRTLVPFRPIFEALGAEVEYDKVFKRVTATKEGSEVELTIGERIGKKNGAEITMGVAPVLLKGTTLVPLRFVAESLDAKVDYDAKTQIINITTDVTPTGTTGGN